MATLLEITQGILSDMSGDDVNSITDTEESEQVARIVISTFNAMVSKNTWPSHRRLVRLVPYSDSSQPTHMSLDNNIKELISISYNKVKLGESKQAYQEMKYMSPDDFLRKLNTRDNTSAEIDSVIDTTGVILFIRNDASPTYYTSFDDTTIVFDSYDSDVDSTLQQSKMQAMAYILPTLALSDTAVPDIPVDAFSALVEEATSRAQLKVAEFQDLKAEQEAGSQKRSLSRKAWKVNANRRYPNYGRRR